MAPQAAYEDAAAKRASVISAMIASLRNGEDRRYYVSLVGYYIEGHCYSADGLSVDLTATPNICRTDAGFACTAMFPPEMLLPGTVETNGLTKITVRGETRDVERVRLEVMLDDIWLVAELIDGRQHELFRDPDALKSGLKGFSSKPH